MKRIVLCASLFVCGCSQQDGDWRADAKFLRDAGFRGKATIIYGGGHVAGQSFNLTGSSGVIEITFDPQEAGNEATD